MSGAQGDNMKNKSFIIFLLILLSSLFLLLLPESTLAAERGKHFGVSSLATKTRSVENFENWPREVVRQFAYEQAKVVTDCSKCGYDNWVVFQTVKGKGKVDGKDVTLFYEGVVVGKYTCDPPELVIKDGKLVETNHYINSRLLTIKVKDAEFICNYICYGWNCVEGDECSCRKELEEEGYDKKQIYSERTMYRDMDHDKRDDISGKTHKEIFDEKAETFEELCEKSGKDCKFHAIGIVRLLSDWWEKRPGQRFGSQYPQEAVIEFCFYCSCIEFDDWPKTTLPEGQLEKLKKRMEEYEKQDLLRDIDRAHVTPQFKSTGAASGHVADLTVTSNADELLTFGLKNTGLEGMLLVNPIEEEQNLVVATVPGISVSPTSYKTADSVTLNPNESITFPIMGYCANFDKKNPSEGIELTLGGLLGVEPAEAFGLDGLLGDTPQTTVIDNLEGTEFPQSFTPEDVLTVKQIALWASQPENKDRTPEDYEARGYPIEEDYVPIIRDVLDQSAVNPDEIVALTGKKKEPEKPATFITSDLTISPAEVDIGESVTIGVLVTNTGDLTGSYEVTLKIDNVPVATEDVTLAGGKSETVTFTIAKDTEGRYTVDIDGKVGHFTVIVPSPPTPTPVPAPTPRPTPGPNWWLIGGIIGGCIVVGLLVYFFVWRKRGAPRPS